MSENVEVVPALLESMRRRDGTAAMQLDVPFHWRLRGRPSGVEAEIGFPAVSRVDALEAAGLRG